MKFFRLVILALAVAAPLFLGLHFWLTDRRGVQQGLYPAEAVFANLSLKCSKGAPAWLNVIAKEGIWGLKSLSTQTAYIDESGRVFHCESGKVSGWGSSEVTQHTRYRYGSLTKPVTSAAVLYMEKVSALSLDGSIAEFFPAPKSEIGKLPSITVDMLLTHTSGIVGDLFSRKNKIWCPYDMPKVWDAIVEKRSVGEAEYSNIGYCILGQIVAAKMQEDYRSSISAIFQLDERGISFAEYENAFDEVERDYRYNDFYGKNNHGRFDYFALSSTAGMTGSATAYAKLIKGFLDLGLDEFQTKDVLRCEVTEIRKCYGRAFYAYRPVAGGDVVNVKEGYMPGAAGVVVINPQGGVFVWLGNSDTSNARDGLAMKGFIDKLVGLGF